MRWIHRQNGCCLHPRCSSSPFSLSISLISLCSSSTFNSPLRIFNNFAFLYSNVSSAFNYKLTTLFDACTSPAGIFDADLMLLAHSTFSHIHTSDSFIKAVCGNIWVSNASFYGCASSTGHIGTL